MSRPLALLNDCTDNESLNTYLRQLSRLYLVVSAFEYRESLSPELQSEIASIVGINPSREEVLTANFIAHGGEDINPEKLVVLADLPYPTSHYGEIHRQFCYSFERQAFVTNDVFVSSDVEDAAALTERPLSTGTIFTAKAYNYLGVSVVPRVLLEEKHFLQAAELDNISGSGCAATTPLPALKSVRNLQEACDAKSRYFEQNPFADFYPVVVEHVRFAQQGSKLSGTWFLCDQDGKARALSGHKEKLHKHVVSCLALTFGHDFTAVVLLNDNQMLLCGISYQGQYLSLPLGELQLFFNRAS